MSNFETPGEAPVGVFDSGVGGLTVFRALEAKLGNESFVYLGDTARIPYGARSAETVRKYARECAAFIHACGVKVVVVACNTVSALALDSFRLSLEVPVIGVIEPGARRAAELTRSRRVGVIATEATVKSAAYELAIKDLDPRISVFSRSCPLFVPLAEEGWGDRAATRLVAEEYLSPLRGSAIDTLVLGCTHYPILRPVIHEVMGGAMSFVDSGESVADEVAGLLIELGLERRGAAARFERFYVTDSPSRFQRVAEVFLGRAVDDVECIELGVL